MDIVSQIAVMVDRAKKSGCTPLEVLVPWQRAKEMVEVARKLERQTTGKPTVILGPGMGSQHKNVGLSTLFGLPVRLSLGDELLIGGFQRD